MAKQDDRVAKMAPYEEAIQITMELNQAYHSPEKRRDLMAQLIGKPVDESFTLFPPFYSDYGKNIRIGKNVFINSSCHFQDQGGIEIGDGCPCLPTASPATIWLSLLAMPQPVRLLAGAPTSGVAEPSARCCRRPSTPCSRSRRP